MCVHFQLNWKRRDGFFTAVHLCFNNQSIFIQQHEFSSPESKQINIWWAHVSSLVSSTTSPRWAPASTTWRSWRTSPARWWVTTSEVLTKFAKFRWQLYCTFWRLTADNSEKDIVCDQKVCVHHCLLWPVCQQLKCQTKHYWPRLPAHLLLSVTRRGTQRCKWYSGVIQGPASLHFPDQPQARSDRKVTTSLAWLGSRKTGDTGEWKYLPHNSYI